MTRAGWIVTCAVLLVAPVSNAAQATGERMSLSAKARFFYENLLQRHLIDGLFTSHVELLPGGEVDFSTRGICDVAHAACWTGRYLGGVAFWYAVTGDTAVREHGQLILDALYRLHHMTGVPGLLARGYVKGHGPSYEERFHEPHQDEWHQGVPPYQDYRWRGDVSVDNYNGAFFGYALYYDLAADAAQRAQIREEVRALATHIVEHGMRIVDVDGEVTEWGRWELEEEHFGKLPPGRIRQTLHVLPLAAMKIAYHVTGDKRFQREYERLVEKYEFRKVIEYPVVPENPGVSASDACMYLESLYNLCRLEKDPVLVRNYKELVSNLYEFFHDDGNTFFDFVYAALFADTSAAERGLRTLQLFPTDRVVRPVMLSLDPRWQAERGRALPINVRPLDNEYEWKNDGKRLDGWLAETMVSLDFAPEDPLVAVATTDAGQVYRTLDGGETWENVTRGFGHAVPRMAVFSRRRMRILLAATDQGVYRSEDGGLNWAPSSRGLGSREVRQVLCDPKDPLRWYAVTDEGVYESLDEGQTWLDISAGLTSRQHLLVAALHAPVPTLVAASENLIFVREGDRPWKQVAKLEPLFLRLLCLARDPHEPFTVYAASNEFGVLKSTDGGRTWKTVHWRFAFDRPIHSVAVDYREPGTVYASNDEGVWVTRNGGETWLLANEGLPIPLGRGVFTSPEREGVWVSTPAGLFWSQMPEVGWQGPSLCVIERHSPNRFEVGGVDFLMAYWMGRYHGFIPADR